jgi:hypothetical protein
MSAKHEKTPPTGYDHRIFEAATEKKPKTLDLYTNLIGHY